MNVVFGKGDDGIFFLVGVWGWNEGIDDVRRGGGVGDGDLICIKRIFFFFFVIWIDLEWSAGIPRGL